MITRRRGTGRLYAARIRQQVLVAEGHPDPERVRRHMHDAMQAHLADALRECLSARAAEDDDTVWRIRRLQIELVVNAGWDPATLADRWAMALDGAVQRAMASGGDGITVIRFRNPATYLAAFVTAVADGSAWSQWWFGSFDGLRLLPRSTAIRTALLRNPSTIWQAFDAVNPADRAMVFAALSRQDAQRIADAAVQDGDTRDDFVAVLPVLTAIHHRPVSRDDEASAVLRMLVELATTTALRPSGHALRLARAIARLAALRSESDATLVSVMRALRDGDVSALYRSTSPDSAGLMTAIAELPAAHRDVVVGGDVNTAQRAPVAAASDAGEAMHMPVAAPLLLASMLPAMPFTDIARSLPGIGGEGDGPERTATADAILRLYVLATACGGARSATVLDDATSRMLSGVGARVSTAQLRDWVAARSVRDAARFERTIGQWRFRQGHCSASSWLCVTADTDPAPTDASLALLDCARGHWLACRDVGGVKMPDAAASLVPWLRGVRSGAAPHRLRCDDAALWHTLRRVADPATLISGLETDADAADDSALTATLARVPRLRDEIRFVTLPHSLGVPRPMALVLQVVAQGLLRELAWRLPGFSRATLPHLWANFLDVHATVTREPGRLVARVSAPALVLIASMTGLRQQRYRLPWLSHCDVALFAAEDA